MNGWLIQVRPRNPHGEERKVFVNSARVVMAWQYDWGWTVDLDDGETWLVHEDSAPDME